MEPKFSVDADVRLKSQPDRAGRITAPPEFIQGEYWYAVYFGPGQRGRHPEADLDAYTETFDVRQWVKEGRFAGHEAFVKRITYLKLAQSLRSHVYALQSSRTTFYAYQFKPVLKFLDSWKHRLLVADEVGLGKTIETGLILTELRARLDLQRVLIVAPSHLMVKWRTEMQRRFALEFEIFDRARCLDFLNRVEQDGDEVKVRALIPLQTFRGVSLQERWEAVAPTLDVLVFDEAGRLRNPETKSHKAARGAAEVADAVLLLTATPTQTREFDLFALLSLLDPDDFSDFTLYTQRLATNRFILQAMRLVQGGEPENLQEALTHLDAATISEYGAHLAKNPLVQDLRARLGAAGRRTRREVVELQRDLNTLNLFGHIMSRTRRMEVDEERPVRAPHTIACGPSPLEADFYAQVTSLCRAAYRRNQGNSVAAFAVMMPQRQMASCMPAMVDYLRDRLDRGELAIADPEQADLRIADFTDGDPDEIRWDDMRPDWGSLGDLLALRDRLAGSDSKWEKFLEVLLSIERKQPGSKIVVFSFFKRTLAYLNERLAKHEIRAVVISGDVPSVPSDPERDERSKRLERFRDDPRVRVLLSTEVGNEGLDIQFSHVLMNFDLPWNPMTVEQRIGRLDRIGQESKRIDIYNLTMPGTVEDVILERLYERIRIFQQSIGDLEEILGEVLRDLTVDLFSPDLTAEQQEARIVQAANAVEQKRLEQATLESRVSSLIGHDEFFADEIARVRQSRRYITADELLLMVSEFVAAHHPECVLQAKGAGLWSLKVSESLRWFVRATLGQEDAGWFEFQRRSSRGTLEFTTDPGIAQRKPALDLLTFYHPLVQVVAAHYRAAPNELHPVSALSVVSHAVQPGQYVWSVFLTEITGARPLRELDFVVIDRSSAAVVDGDASESLFWDLLSAGRSFATGEFVSAGAAAGALLALGEAAAIERLNARFADRSRLNESMVNGRLESLAAAHQRNVAIRDERLQVARSRNRAPNYIRMLDGGIRKLKSTYEVKRRELEAQRGLGRSITLEAAGIVEVSHG